MTRKRIIQLLAGIALSFVLWYIVFLIEYLGSFWYRVTIASLILAIYAKMKGASLIEGPNFAEIWKGLALGVGLYIVFFIGFEVFKPILLTGAVDIYEIK
jgi:hypothetical protein